MGRKHIEKSSLEELMDKQPRPSNIDLQLKLVNEEIYSCQGGGGGANEQCSGEGRIPKKKVNNLLLKSMVPLMCVADTLYLADITDTPAPSMKAVFDQCMTSLTLLCEANPEVETLSREAFKPTTPTLYKSLITKPGESRTLLFGDNMEDQMKALENKEKLQQSLAQEKATGSKKPWLPLSRGMHPMTNLVPQTKGRHQKTSRVSQNQTKSTPLPGNQRTPKRSGTTTGSNSAGNSLTLVT